VAVTLQRVREIAGMRMHARDGDVGHVHDVYLDDVDWRVRYFHVDTRHWFPGRHVLLAPNAVQSVDWERGHIQVSITREQLRSSPDIDSHKPVSRQHEAPLFEYFQWPFTVSESLWEGEALAARLHTLLMEMRGPEPAASGEQSKADDPHLWSARALRHYRVETHNAGLGRISDFLVEPDAWAIRYLIVDKGGPIHVHRFLLSVNAVHRISWDTRLVRVALADETNGGLDASGDASC